MADRKKYTLEFSFNARPELIYNYISTPSGLAAWFADDVNINGDDYSFFWEGSEEKARVVKRKPNKLIKFNWIDRNNDEHLTFEIEQDDLTGDTALLITDYDDEEELEEARLMWGSAIEQLHNTIGG